MASLMLLLLLSLGDICLRVGCALLSLLSAVGVGDETRSAAAALLGGADMQQRCAGGGGGHSESNLAGAAAGAWKSSGAGSSGSFSSSSSSVSDLDLVSLKLLFLPSLGILVLLAFLLEEGCAAHNQQQQAAAAANATGQPATGGGAGGGVCGWLRSWCLRGPRLTSAYQAQLQANAAALVLAHTQQHAVHAHMTHMAMHHGGTGVCCGGLNCAGAISNGSPPKKMHVAPSATANGTASSALDHGGGGPGSSGSMVAPLSLRLDGYNHLHNAAGPLLYYQAFQRDLPDVRPAQSATAALANSVSAVADSKPEDKIKQQTSTTKQKKKQAASDAMAVAMAASSMEKASSSPRSASPAPSSPKLIPSSSPSPASSGLPPASEFVPLTLVNSSTGFSCTLRLWSGLTFAEILKHYVATYWTEERSKYEAMEGGGRDEDPEVEVLNAILERAPETTPATLATNTAQSKKKQSAAAIAAAAAAQAAKQAAAAAAVSSRAPQPPLMLRYQGVRVSPFLTPAAVFPPPPSPPPQPQQPQVQPALPADVAAVVPASASASSAAAIAPPPPPPVLEVCIDYILLFDRARLSSHELLRKESVRVQGCLEMQHKLIAEVARTEGEIAALSKKQREATDKHTSVSNDLKRVSKDAERIAKELASLVKTRTDLESSMASSVGLVSNARARIESEYRALRAEYDAKVAAHTRSKSDYQSLLDSRHDSSLALKQAMISCETSLRRLNTLKVAKNKREKLQEKIKKMEGVLGMGLVATGTVAAGSEGDAGSDGSSAAVSSLPPLNAALAMKQRYDLLESEHNVLNVTLNELRLQSHEIDEMSKNENYKLRYRLKLLEKDARDLVKWKTLARSHESDAKEAVQWKNALKQAKARERALEHEYKETSHWKARARAMEREVRELRQWKARLDATGLGGEMPAAFARDSLAMHNPLGASISTDFDSGAIIGSSESSLLPRHSRTGSMDHDFSSHNHTHSHSQPDLDAAFAASFAAFQQQQQRRSDSSALRANGDSGSSFSASSLHGSGIDPDELAELHSSSAFDRAGHYSSAWSSFGGGGGGSGVDGGGGLGMDVPASGEDPDADFTHNHPALSFLAE